MVKDSATRKNRPHRSAAPGVCTGYRIPRALLVAFQEAGVDLAGLCRDLAIDLGALGTRLAAAQADEFLARAFAKVEDPAFGLTVGAKVRPELFGVVGFAAMSCATYRDALSRIARYKQVMGGDQVELLAKGAVTVIRSYPGAADRSFARQVVDGEFAFLVAFGRFLTEQPIRPVRVALAFARPAYHARYAAFFECPVVFDAAESEIEFRNSDLELPLVSSNSELVPLFDEKAEEMRTTSEGEIDLIARVRSALRRMLRGQMPDLGVLTRELGMSQRSLQRKLAQAGVSFQALIDEVRLELARRYLKNQQLDAAEVSYLLGFSHPNSFYRAFKRWTRVTPEEYRRLPP